MDKTEFESIDDTIRNITNQQVAMKTNFKILDMMHHDHITPPKPMAAFAANYFQVYSSNLYSQYIVPFFYIPN